MMTRRHVLASALGATALALAPAISPAAAQGAAVGTIRVEALPSVVEAWGPNLPMVKAELAKTLTEILGSTLQRGAGTRLVVTIGRLWLASDIRGGRFSGASDDYLESTATLYDRSGRPLASYPIRSTESSSGAGNPQVADVDPLRLRALARNNAWWIRHYLAG
ncbi:hypothetical protein ASE61_13945 [Bosea sp. Root670]|uniref:hypothetical protein n=1 Tax=Bosea sp. Root670 TaxID=1736583 RepID=UPI00071553C3|nr:hypothetical protein [Bosea sp. Root670]KRE02396.1 hypothetical protein ASE61_13945 [Bosea sp. Root670]